MSFSGMVKEELSKQIGMARHCRIAELAAIFCSCGHMESVQEGQKILRIHTENEAVARKCFTFLQKTFNIETAITIHESGHPKRGNVYLIEIRERERIEEAVCGTKVFADGNTGGIFLQSNAQKHLLNSLFPRSRPPPCTLMTIGRTFPFIDSGRYTSRRCSLSSAA